MEHTYPNLPPIHWVSNPDSPEFTQLSYALTHSSIVAIDAEWKPVRHHPDPTTERTFPTVSLLQLACRLARSPSDSSESTQTDSVVVFLVDLQSVPLSSIYGPLKEMLVAYDVLKLGFKFKQDLVYLSSTFCNFGCDPGFDKAEPFLDISSIYYLLQQRQHGRSASKDSKSLATICKELLGLSLSKELQCSDWSQRPLTEEQKIYAAVDAHCLLELFTIFELNIDKEASSSANNADSPGSLNLNLGLKEILDIPTADRRIISTRVDEASNIIKATTASEFFKDYLSIDVSISDPLCRHTIPLNNSFSEIISKYSSKILLKESDRKPRNSRKVKKQSASSSSRRAKGAECLDDWQGPPPWDLLNGGDGHAKFLCDVMVEGLAKHLRCVGIDAAVPYSKKPDSRELIEQALKEKRVLLTRDAKLFRHDYLLKNQIYRVRSLLKNEQLLEVIQTFQLNISEDRLMSRCTKCNGRFIQKPLTTDEAIQAAKGFQKIPSCLFNKNLEFWKCMDCNQLYWEGTQYHNAVQKFVNICNLSE
ncbi:uncharacterized protein LOC141606401 isoform X2 [Silene latifolia]|uniref:uncharacterized protein LOC141606401 isoform X1 n=1 Tax=Silene latifolia TaxID=37657 RepID=UPI003D7799CE